jgi:hypothetical protein
VDKALLTDERTQRALFSVVLYNFVMPAVGVANQDGRTNGCNMSNGKDYSMVGPEQRLVTTTYAKVNNYCFAMWPCEADRLQQAHVFSAQIFWRYKR